VIEPIDIQHVEDNPNDAELTMRALRPINLANRLHWVKDGAEALDFLFATGAYADRTVGTMKLVLLDIKLPKVDGIEVLARIRADERTRLTPVVMLTSSAEERDLVESYKLGVNSYLIKPVDFGRFVETVSQAGLYWMVTNYTLSQKRSAP
jgi:two-component system response regulator